MKRFQTLIKGGVIFLSLLMALVLFTGCAGSAGGGDTSGGGNLGGGGDTGGGTPNPAAVYISAFCPNHSISDAADDNGYGWVEVRVADASALNGVEWTLKYSTYKYAPTTLLSSTDISSWTLANDDVIRIHNKSSSVTTDTDKSQNNAEKWDYKTAATFFLSTSYAHVWIEKADGTHIDTVAYTTSKNTSNFWLADGDPTKGEGENAANLTASVSAGIWGGATLTDAITVNGQYAKLIDDTTEGNAKADWQDVSLDDLVATVNSIPPAKPGASVTLTVNVQLFGAEAVNGSVTATSADLSFADTALTDNSDGTYSADITIPADATDGAKSITVSIPGTVNASYSTTTSVTVDQNALALVFSNSDMEGNIVVNSFGLWSSASYVNVTGHDGNATRALYLNGSATKNLYVFTTEGNCYGPGTATTVTFWIKGTSSTETISINMGGRKFNLGTVTDATTTPIADSGSNSYTGSINCTNWTKVTLDITGAGVDVAAGTFALKIGGDSTTPVVWDLYIDKIIFE